MFSRRLPPLHPNRIGRAVDAARAAGARLYDLTESNPTTAGFDYPTAEILDALADPRALTYQPTPHGLPEARVAIAAYYARLGQTVDPERLFVTASTSESYANLFKLLCDPGDQVLVPEPSYPLFELLAGLEAVRLTPYPLRYHGGWYLDVDELGERVDGATRAILLVNPNNPTGSFLKRGERMRLEALCRERELCLISDEVFADYTFGEDLERVSTLVDADEVLTFSLSGLSKPCGLPQLKLGWIHVGGAAAVASPALERLELVCDTYLSVAAPVQHAAPRLVPLCDRVGAQIAARVRANRTFVATRIAGTAVQLLDAEGGWYAVLRVPRVRSDEEWTLAALAAGVLIHPGFFFDFADEGHLVLSLLGPAAELEEGLGRLLAVIDQALA